MAIKFQYNKTAMQKLKKDLGVRERALPTLQNKESALRMEVRKSKDRVEELRKAFEDRLNEIEEMAGLWCEFDPELLAIEDVNFTIKKIAGVKIPILEDLVFKRKGVSIFNAPAWLPEGIELVKELAEIVFETEFSERKMDLLNFARKKTTQKVNLYEKVQIPGFKDALLKIKRFLEDAENLSKAAQKIVKKRQNEAEVG